MKPAVRRARPADAAPLLALIHDHARFERSVASITAPELEGLLTQRRGPVELIVADLGGEITGYAALTWDFSLWRARHWAHLDCLYVREDRRGHGIGRRLLAHAVRRARRRDADRLEWQTPEWNGEAIRFYRRAGAESAAKTRFWLAVG